MAAVIKLKRGTSTPSTSDIASGEVAVDTSAAKLYINDSGTVKEIGGGGGVTSDAQYNTVAGTQAGDSFSGTSAEYNSFYGYDAGTANTTGDGGVAVGYQALATNNTGSYNTAVGYRAAQNNEGASSITAVGMEALRRNTSGEANVGIGAYALSYNTTSSNSVAVGQQSLYNNTGHSNAALGHQSGMDISTGDKNICIGYQAGNSGTNDITTGDNNILIGYQAAASSATISNEVTIGDTNITKFRIPGLNFVVKDTTATEDYVLTVDANGEAGWEAAAGGTPTAITVADESSDTTCFPLFATAATGDLGPKSGSNLTFNSSTGALAATLLNGGAGDDLSLDFGSVA